MKTSVLMTMKVFLRTKVNSIHHGKETKFLTNISISLTTDSFNNKVKSNITASEHNALSDLQKDHSIIIKEADKGGAFVIMDRDYYIKRMSDMLKDGKMYKEIKSNREKQILTKIKKLTAKHGQNLTDKETDFLLNFETKCSNLYGLPKIHQSNEIKTRVNELRTSYTECDAPKNLKFRPIVAGPTCPTHRLSQLIDHLLKPYVDIVPSYIKDDFDFLRKLPESVKPESYLVTFDVNSLYTNIPHDVGLSAVEYWIKKHPNLLPSRFNAKFITESIKLILENNVFFFDDKYYNQLHGTAIGTKMAPVYATLFLG